MKEIITEFLSLDFIISMIIIGLSFIVLFGWYYLGVWIFKKYNDFFDKRMKENVKKT